MIGWQDWWKAWDAGMIYSHYFNLFHIISMIAIVVARYWYLILFWNVAFLDALGYG